MSPETGANRKPFENYFKQMLDIGSLPVKRANTVDQDVRDYRNFVHPRVELRATHDCGETEATLAKAGFDSVCNTLNP